MYQLMTNNSAYCIIELRTSTHTQHKNIWTNSSMVVSCIILVNTVYCTLNTQTYRGKKVSDYDNDEDNEDDQWTYMTMNVRTARKC